MSETVTRARVLVLGGSIRASGKSDHAILSAVEAAGSVEELRNLLDPADNRDTRNLSNSEFMAGFALYGAREGGCDVDYMSLRRLFPVVGASESIDTSQLDLDGEALSIDTTKIDPDELKTLEGRVEAADALILLTPVYFGDRSSVADTLLKILHRRDLLRGRAFSVLSVGAKRNGGQETTNVFALFDGLNMGALVHGNGPKTSQYGGTAVAGDRGRVLDDDFGIETSCGTGRRSAQLARIRAMGRDHGTLGRKLQVKVLISVDNGDREIERTVRRHFEAVASEHEFDFINLSQFKVERCLACKICPFPPMVEKGSKGHFGSSTDYACIIDNGQDQMELIRERLKGMDALVVAGVNDDSIAGLVDSYQSFTERTRFIRRANFEWMNTPFTSFVLKHPHSMRDRLFGLRVMTSYMRHNAIGCRPIRVAMGDHGRPEEAEAQIRDFLDAAAMIRAGRDRLGGTRVAYIAGGTGGYADTRLDETSAVRV